MTARVSVIVPCYNQAHFLADAIESALGQTHRPFELVVVDDGSTDDTRTVAGRYPGVRCLRQANRGVAAARNAGLRLTTGEYVVFLDADDRLLPCALDVGVSALAARAAAAFAVGLHRRIAADGSPLTIGFRPRIDGDAYATLVRRCSLAVPAVTYRRTVLERVGGFAEHLRHAEDYELYLRITRAFPIVDHFTEVAEYRQHPGMATANAVAMLAATLAVLRQHRPGPCATASHHAAYRARENAVWFYNRVLDAAIDDLAHRRVAAGTRKLLLFARYLPLHPDYALSRLGTPLRLARRAVHGHHTRPA